MPRVCGTLQPGLSVSITEKMREAQIDCAATALNLQLCGFLRSEMSAVEANASAIATFDAAPYARILRHNLRSHEERVRLLSAEILRLGGVISPGPQLWTAEVADQRLPHGLVATMAALAAGEERDRRIYVLALETVDAATRPFMRWLLSEQRDSLHTVIDLQEMMAALSKRPDS